MQENLVVEVWSIWSYCVIVRKLREMDAGTQLLPSFLPVISSQGPTLGNGASHIQGKSFPSQLNIWCYPDTQMYVS